MIRSFATALCALAFGATSAGAVVVEVPLPALQGTYDPRSMTGYSRTAAFTLPQLPSVIRSVSIRLRGSRQVGRINCDFPSPHDLDWNCVFLSEIIESEPGGWTTDFGPTGSDGAFEYTFAYEPWSTTPLSPQPTWAFLADGEGELTLLAADTNPLMCAELSDPPSGEIEEATLLVDMDFAVSAAPRSWGQIKLIYR